MYCCFDLITLISQHLDDDLTRVVAVVDLLLKTSDAENSGKPALLPVVAVWLGCYCVELRGAPSMTLCL